MDHTDPPRGIPSAGPMPHEGATLLPGVLALFGFQLLIVFSSAFQDGLDRTEQRVHLVAIALVALAIAALLTPAACASGFGRSSDSILDHPHNESLKRTKDFRAPATILWWAPAAE